MSRPLATRVGLVLSVLLFAVVSFAFSQESQVESEPAPGPVADVVLFAVPHLGIDDVDPAVMPTLSRLAGEGAIAATNVRSRGDRPVALDAYATLGAGNRVAVGELPEVVPEGGVTTTTAPPEQTSDPDPTGDEPVPPTSRPVTPTARTVTAVMSPNATSRPRPSTAVVTATMAATAARVTQKLMVVGRRASPSA